MALPINIEDLVNGNTIEWERLEFKQGWNPEDVIHSMCAFANDLHNWGGGYIIVGVSENKGQPVLPPAGIEQNQLDRIQGEIVGLANKIQPNYFPITEPYVLQDQHILVLWCPAGDNRPYTAPTTLGNRAQRQCYIRIGSQSIVARGENLRRLQELAARIPFDDRINNQASLNDLDLGLIREYLQEIKSGLLEESAQLPFADLCRTMHLAKGPNEDIRPVNAGLLFFSKEPHKFFERAWIELVLHKDYSGKNFKEMYFRGPIHKQLRELLSFIKTNIISEQVIKHADKAESDRFFNYPFNAIEESLSNAVYHKSYEYGAPIEIQIFPDRITILSHPGPVPPVNAKVLASQRQIIAREYRNRRIGDFLKELHLTEGRGTGFPTIYDSMAQNGSPKPAFETDEATYVLVTIPIHDNFKGAGSDQVNDQVNSLVFNSIEDIITFCKQESHGVTDGAKDGFSNSLSNEASNEASNEVNNEVNNEVSNKVNDIVEKDVGKYVKAILLMIENKSLSSTEILNELGLTKQTKNKKKHIDPLIELGWIVYTIPENPKDRNQKYRITMSGKNLLKIMNKS